MKPDVDEGRGIEQGQVSARALKLGASVCLAIILLAFAILLLVALNSDPPNPPQFRNLPITASTSNITYDFLGRRPFEEGRMWVGALSGQTNWQMFVFDIENRRTVGRLTNGWPAMLFGDPPRLLCSQRTAAVPTWKRLWEKFLKLIRPIFGKRIKLKPSDIEAYAYWLLDLEQNNAKWLGNIPGTANFTEVPSPDFRYCFAVRHGRAPSISLDYYLLDLHRRQIRKLDAPADAAACGWWDNSRILFETTTSDFVLYDVRTKATAPLITFGSLGGFLEQNKLTFGTSRPHAFTIWNGRENDFYLTDLNKKWLGEESFLIKLERPDGRLKLLSSRFKFEWSDHLDSSGQLYLYSGRERGDGSDGVFLRHLDTGANRVLVAPTTNKSHSIPRFYRDSVIYIRSNALWRINLDGSNNVKLFPPDPRP